MDKRVSRNLVFGILILLLACGVRLLYLNSSFWYDEACSWLVAKLDFPFGIVDYLWNKDLQHTPLYFFILHFWMKLFGASESAIQSLSLIFGVGAIPLVYIVSKKLTSVKNALIVSAIIAICPILVYFSAEARMYSMVTFLVLLSLNYLVDFEQKKDTKSLIKLVIANVLIPYTLVGGILYNISLLACYSIYLYKNKKEDLCKYLTGVLSEIVLLIPYFALIIHYAIMRNSFVIKHEGQLAFFNIVDVVRNFFGTNIISNVYWTSDAPYNLTLAFSLLVILPCVYFLYGLIQGFRHSENCFVKTLYSVFFLNFVLMVLVASCQISVFTGRYILYILPPLFILAVVGLAAKLSQKHLVTFVVFFVVCSTYFDITNFTVAKDLKTLAFKSIYLESQELELNADDLIIMPFGSDAPYYFRTSDTPRVLNFDFHKEARNPYNEKFYDKNQMPLMSKDVKYSLIYDIVHSNNGFSENHFKYFINNVNATVPSGRYVMIALYGDDANALVPLDVLKNSVQSLKDVKSDILSIMLKKYLVDVVAYLEFDFKFVKRYTKGNYTYLIFQKK